MLSHTLEKPKQISLHLDIYSFISHLMSTSEDTYWRHFILLISPVIPAGIMKQYKQALWEVVNEMLRKQVVDESWTIPEAMRCIVQLREAMNEVMTHVTCGSSKGWIQLAWWTISPFFYPHVIVDHFRSMSSTQDSFLVSGECGNQPIFLIHLSLLEPLAQVHDLQGHLLGRLEWMWSEKGAGVHFTPSCSFRFRLGRRFLKKNQPVGLYQDFVLRLDEQLFFLKIRRSAGIATKGQTLDISA
jgi:hypothetical protein